MSLNKRQRQALATLRSPFEQSGPESRLADGPQQARGEKGQNRRHFPPIVTIFGAGIAGLSAAHELIERGFDVQVVEPTRSPHDEYAVEVGGLARNQFGRVPENPNILHAGAGGDVEMFRQNVALVRELRAREMQPVQPRFPVPWRIRFRPNESKVDRYLTDEWGIPNAIKLHAVWETLTAAKAAYGKGRTEGNEDLITIGVQGDNIALDEAWTAREELFVEVRGHSANDGSELENRALSCARAKAVIECLKRMNDDDSDGPKLFPFFLEHFKEVGVGSLEPLGDQRDERWRNNSNRVEFRIVEQLVPGEHGYRFFPAFYRHLFDMMRRTPTLDANGHATGSTAFDRLVPTADLGLAVGDGLPPALIETRGVRSVEELRKLSGLFLGRLGVTHRDIVRFQTRLLKFLTSSSLRREREYQNRSWWQFLGGDDERGYSPKMKRYLMDTSQALVAMNAEETDARSQGNIVSQLQLHYLKDESDFTLNGPTSDVWLRPWKDYLKRQGVRFFIGELGGLRWTAQDDPELVPVTTQQIGWLGPPVKPELLRQLNSPEVNVARPTRRAVVVEVLGNDDGDYMVGVKEDWYCFTARNCTREQIAAGLLIEISRNELVSVTAIGSRLILRERSSETLDLRLGVPGFDDTDVRGDAKDTPKITVKAVRTIINVNDAPGVIAALNKLVDELVQFHQPTSDAGAGEQRAPNRGAPVLMLEPAQWLTAARLRAEDSAFDAEIGKFEEKWKQEVVPCLTVLADGHRVELSPSSWAKKELEKETDAIARGMEPDDVRLLCPYYFRIRQPAELPAATATGDAKGSAKSKNAVRKNTTAASAGDGGAPAQGTLPLIWVRVRNCDRNLAIVADPTPEDPRHNFRSVLESPPSSRPDFYVLALPFVDASRVVWRAEKERPGTLHGCLAELLDFDRRSGRRTAIGEPVRLIRDANGRPPRDYPLRDFAGVQYYFRNQVRIGKGHLYYPRAEWGLSSISQLAYWRERMSPAGPFVGQLSVDIGDFYMRAAARFGNRTGRSGWNSSSQEIAAEVWFQVRQSLERERAGVLVAPSYYHLDQGLTFGRRRGSRFRDQVVIEVRPHTGLYTIWLNDLPFLQPGGAASREIAERLCEAINQAPFQAVRATVTASDDSNSELKIESTIADDSALIIIRGHSGGRFEITLGDKQYFHLQPPGVVGSPEAVRNGLFESLVRDPDLAVIPLLSGTTGIVLSPKGPQLPTISVRNDHQQLDVTYGRTLHIRLEQSDGGLSFKRPDDAIIGENDTPFLINVPGQWQYRPGLFVAEQLTFEETALRPAADERIRYRISNRRWVAAGTYMATTTQLTTMESANESARHAVNAILRCLAGARPGDEYNSQGLVFADLAETWDPEKYEIDDLEPLKRLDQKLVAEGLPHVMDILKITDAVDAMPMHGTPSQDPVANILHLLQHVVDGSDRDWAFAKQTLTDLLGQAVERGHGAFDPLGLLRELGNGPSAIFDRIRQVLQSMMTPPAGASRDGGAGS